jgi:hypothetical protein
MRPRHVPAASLLLAVALAGCSARDAHHDAEHQRLAREQAAAAAEAGFARLVALQGEWVDTTGQLGPPDVVQVTYRVTGGGSAVVETLFPGSPHEMVTVYHRDGTDLVLTHYCAAGNQPRMRAKTFAGDAFAFDFDGGTNLDPAVDAHAHNGVLRFLPDGTLESDWDFWQGGKVEHQQPAVLRRVD